MSLKKKNTTTSANVEVSEKPVNRKQTIQRNTISNNAVQERNKALDAVRISMLTKFGNNSMRSGADLKKTKYVRIPTGSVDLDDKIGGGIPIGRAIHIAGDFSAGKSTIADHIIAQAQNLTVEYDWVDRSAVKGREQVEVKRNVVKGLTVAIIDVEGTKDTDWSEDVGIDFDSVLYATPEGQEETMDLVFKLQKEGINLIVLDSVDSLVPTKEYTNEDSNESYQMGIKAKLMGTMLRKYTNYNNRLVREGKLPCTFILLNQLRSKIGAYGNPDFTGGGRAIDFYTSIAIFLKKGDMIKDGAGKDAEIVGQEVKFNISKNKTYKPRMTGTYDLYFQETEEFSRGQIDNVKSLIVLGIEYGVLEQAGSWFKLDGENLAQGVEKLVAYVKNNPKVYDDVLSRISKIREDSVAKIKEKK